MLTPLLSPPTASLRSKPPSLSPRRRSCTLSVVARMVRGLATRATRLARWLARMVAAAPRAMNFGLLLVNSAVARELALRQTPVANFLRSLGLMGLLACPRLVRSERPAPLLLGLEAGVGFP